MKAILSFIFLLFSSLVMAQNTDALISFEPWFGHWEGPLEIHTPSGRQDSLNMRMEVGFNSTADSLIWKIEFIQGDRVIKKPYAIYYDTQTPGFILDERNSILIPTYVMTDQCFNFYEVMGRYFMVKYEAFDKNTIAFSITIIDKSKPFESGGKIIQGDTIPVVTSFPVTMVQKALLQRKE